MPALTIDIEARLAQFQDGLDRVARQSERAAKRIEGGFAAVSKSLGLVGAALSAGAIVQGLNSTIQSMADLQDASEKTGASVESLSSIMNSLGPSGATIGEVVDIAGKLQRAMAGADDETKGAGAAFAALGVNTLDAAGNLRNVDDVLFDVSNALAKYEDGTNKVALAQALLGKTGAQVLPYFKDLAENGRVAASVTAEQAQAADDLQKAWGRLVVEGKRLATEAIGPVVTQVVKLIEQFNAGREAAGGFWKAVYRYGFTNPGTSPDEQIAKTTKRIAELQAQIQKDSQTSGFFGRGARGLADRRIEAAQAEIAQLEKDVTYWRTLSAQSAPKTPDAPRPQAPRIASSGAGSSAARAAREQLKEVEDYATRIREQVASAIQDNDVTRAREYADRIAELDRLFFDAGLDVETYDAALRKLAGIRPPNDITEELQRQADLIRESLDPLAKFRKELELIDKLELNNLLTGSEASLKRFLIGNEIDGLVTGVKELSAATDEASNFARDLGLTFSSAFEDAVVGGNSLRDVLEGLGKDLLRIGTRKLVTEPLGKFFEQMVTGGGGSSGNWISTLVGSFFGGARADGGPVSAGRSYLVGERGPEMFVPAMSGAIVPNGAGGTVVNMTVVTQDAESFRRSEGQIAQRLSGIASRGSRFA